MWLNCVDNDIYYFFTGHPAIEKEDRNLVCSEDGAVAAELKLATGMKKKKPDIFVMNQNPSLLV